MKLADTQLVLDFEGSNWARMDKTLSDNSKWKYHHENKYKELTQL